MKLKDKRLVIFLSIALILTAAASVFRTVALRSDFNSETGFFEKEGFITAATALIFSGVLVSLVYIFAGKPKQDIVPDFHGAVTYIPSGLLAVALAFFTTNTAFNSGVSADDKATAKLLVALTALSALATIVYLVLNPLLGRRYSACRGAAAFAPIIFLLAASARLYFDTSMPINAPNKNVEQLAVVFAMLFFTGEARLSLGREKWSSYVSLGIAASALCAYSSIPAVLVYFMSGVGGAEPLVISSHITASVMVFALFVFISSRVLLVAFLSSNQEGKLASYIESSSCEEGEEESPRNEYQISIDDIIESTEEAGSESDK